MDIIRISIGDNPCEIYLFGVFLVGMCGCGICECKNVVAGCWRLPVSSRLNIPL